MSKATTFDQSTINVPVNANFLFKYWDEECVVYNNLSGETHLLELHGAKLLSSINEQPKTYQVLLNKLAADFDGLPQAEIADYLENTLSHFQKTNLIKIQLKQTKD